MIYNTFGQTLAYARTKSGISQTELANRANFNHSYVSRLESGKRRPTHRAVHRLAGALGYAANDARRDILLDAAGFAHTDIRNALPFPELGDLIDAYDAADEDAQRRVREAVEMLSVYAVAHVVAP